MGVVAEWSKALDSSSSLYGGVGSNPTHVKLQTIRFCFGKQKLGVLFSHFNSFIPTNTNTSNRNRNSSPKKLYFCRLLGAREKHGGLGFGT